MPTAKPRRRRFWLVYVCDSIAKPQQFDTYSEARERALALVAGGHERVLVYQGGPDASLKERTVYRPDAPPQVEVWRRDRWVIASEVDA